MTTYRYEIDPRPTELGGGWRLRLFEDGCHKRSPRSGLSHRR